jgi:hypothetical protein
VISAQALQYNDYYTGYGEFGSTLEKLTPDKCGVTTAPESEQESLQQVLAYELGQNAVGLAKDAGYPEEPDETDTNGIMEQLVQSKGISFSDNMDKDEGTNKGCAIMSGTAFCNAQRESTFVPGKGGLGILDVTAGQIVGPAGWLASDAPVVDSTGNVVGARKCTCTGSKCNPPAPKVLPKTILCNDQTPAH